MAESQPNVPGTLQHRAVLLGTQKNRCREASLRRTSELRRRFKALGTAWKRGNCSLRSVLIMPPAPSQRAWKASKAGIIQMQWHCDCCLESLSRVSELAIFRSSDVTFQSRLREAIGCCLKALLEVVNQSTNGICGEEPLQVLLVEGRGSQLQLVQFQLLQQLRLRKQDHFHISSAESHETWGAEVRAAGMNFQPSTQGWLGGTGFV